MPFLLRPLGNSLGLLFLPDYQIIARLRLFESDHRLIEFSRKQIIHDGPAPRRDIPGRHTPCDERLGEQPLELRFQVRVLVILCLAFLIRRLLFVGVAVVPRRITFRSEQKKIETHLIKSESNSTSIASAVSFIHFRS